MASIGKDPNGGRRILFCAPDGKRKTVRLGRVSQHDAATIKLRIEQLLMCQTAGLPWNNQTARWVAEIPDTLAAKLAAVGLVPPRPKVDAGLLGTFIDDCAASRANLKPNTVRNYATTRRLLVGYFGDSRRLDTITAGDADAWRQWLLKTYSPATVSREVKRARQFFRVAVRTRLLADNPFAELPSPAQVNSTREHFVSREQIDRVIRAAPDAEWRLIIALSRYGGLRCPSEHLALTWSDVDWEQNRITIRSPKTAHLACGGIRVVPLFPELRPYLEAVFDAAEPGTKYVVTRYQTKNANLRTQFQRIIERAGIKPWPRLFHNLRASRQTELSGEFPLHVACDWLGNSAAVAQRHYLQTTDEHFAKAVAGKPEGNLGTENGTADRQSGTRAAQKQAQHNAASLGMTEADTKKAREFRAIVLHRALASAFAQIAGIPPTGVEPVLPD